MDWLDITPLKCLFFSKEAGSIDKNRYGHIHPWIWLLQWLQTTVDLTPIMELVCAAIFKPFSRNLIDSKKDVFRNILVRVSFSCPIYSIYRENILYKMRLYASPGR